MMRTEGPGSTPPDLWPEIERRLQVDSGDRRSMIMHSEHVGEVTGARRLAVVLVALGLSAVSLALVVRSFSGGPAEPNSGPSPSTPLVVAWSGLVPGWNDIAEPPQVRSEAVTVWTGRTLLVWAGTTGDGDRLFSDGFVYDPASEEWTAMPEAPLSPRRLAGGVWTGISLLVWGGKDDTGALGDGASFDPKSGAWKMIPASPIAPRAPLASLWTGTEFIVWGSTHEGPHRTDGAAYDPVTEAWRILPQAPIELTLGAAAWTGSEMVVVGGPITPSGESAPPTAQAAAFSPPDGRWTLLPSPGLSGLAVTGAWDGSAFIAWDYLLQSASLHLGQQDWEPLGSIPIERQECSPLGVAIPGLVFGQRCDSSVVLARGMWKDVTSAWGSNHQPPFPVPAGAVVVVLAEGVEGPPVVKAYLP